MSTYKRKTVDTWEVQADYGHGYGWECVCTELKFREAYTRLLEYRCYDVYAKRLRVKLVRERIGNSGGVK